LSAIQTNLCALVPVWPNVGINRAACGAHHALTELRDDYVITIVFDVKDRLVMAAQATRRERTDAVGTHVGQCHHWLRLTLRRKCNIGRNCGCRPRVK
jgi:hypothetical protein